MDPGPSAAPAPSSSCGLLSLPAEVQEHILSLAGGDDASLLSSEATCRAWRDIIRDGPIYRRKCLHYRRRHPDADATFRRHRFADNSAAPGWCKRFYFGLVKTRRAWLSAERGAAAVTVVRDCMGVEVDGRRVDPDDEWGRRHNYHGVYDMVYDKESGRLFCSVYDTIQVWDADELRCLKLLPADLLDGGPTRPSPTVSFYAWGDWLICGTKAGTIKVVDIWREEVCDADGAEEQRHRGVIVDVKVHDGEELATLDAYGAIKLWKLNPVSGRIQFVEESSPPCDQDGVEENVRNLYRRRNFERTLDFNSEVVVTNTLELLVLFSRRINRDGLRTATFVSCPGMVLCLRAYGRSAYWGMSGGVVARADLYLSPALRVVSDMAAECELVKTPFQDNITSLDVAEDRVVVGDVNGELHVCAADRFGLNKDRAPDYSMDSGRKYKSKSFVWCVKMDGERVFSGDQDGKLVVHDFWAKDSESVGS